VNTPVAACPACGSVTTHALHQAKGLNFHRCGRCDLVFVHPQPRDQVRAKYTHEYDLASHFGAWAPRKRVLSNRRLAHLSQPRSGQDRLCDVGCADGQFLQAAAERGWRTFGIELNPPAAAAARVAGAEVVVGVLEEIDELAWGSFDVVTCWDVLEHTPDPRPFSERLVRLVAPGGTLVVSTLNYQSLVRLWFGFRWSMICEDHFTYWNARSLRQLFDVQGLKLVRLTTFGIGRDFVAGLDRLRHRRQRGDLDPNPLTTTTDLSWDVNPAILAVENLCNRMFALVGGGVGLEAVFSKD
jgi:2-polyprenyl-3-methyl-5-hydroxy-6-metoxy-1,4-benzoquinol methylase